MSAVQTRLGWLLSSFLVASCGASGARAPYRPDPSSISLADGEVRIEKTLHESDMIEAEIYSFEDAPGQPIDTCIQSNSDVIERHLAWRLSMGKTFGGDDKVARQRYYNLLQEATPAQLMPIIHLREHYHEAVRTCVLALIPGTPQEAKQESNISILLTANFEAETSKGIVVVDFMTHWCGPCKRMAPSLERLAREYKGTLKVARLDLDRNMAMAKRFGVNSLPTLLILKDGSEVARLLNGHVYAELKAWAERVMQEQRSN